jgi:PAS domain S-box-containing protein
MLGTVVVQILCLMLFIWYTVVTQRREGEERARARIVRQLDRLSAACSTELEQHDIQSLESALELSRIAPTIEIARVTDLQGKTLAVTENGRDRELDSFEMSILPSATRRHVFKVKNDQLEAVTPVIVEGRSVALLWLEPSTPGSSTTMTVVQIAMTYGGFALLANLLPLFVIVRTMTKPLSTLRAASNRVIRDPNLNAGFPLPVTTDNEAGDLTVSVNSMVHELEERRRRLVETVALLDSMLRNAPIGFAFFDRDLRYVRVNEFLAELHGLPIEGHLGRRPVDVYPSSVGEPKVQYLERVFKTGQAVRDVELSGEMPHVPGVQRTWMMHFYPVRATHDVINWVGVIVVEITERLRSEEALRKSEKLAATGRLAASIAHEINNPLEAVTNVLYLLETDETLHEAASQLVATGQAELARVSEITQQTLRFHRQASAATLVNVSELLESLLHLYQSRIKSLLISVSTKLDPSAEIHGYGGELRQVFANLVNNAVDAMPRGGVLRLSARRGHGRDLAGMVRPGVRIFVTDSGTGMSEETRKRIFEAFFTTKEATGTGLGLWVSDGIIRKHAGTMQVRSRLSEHSGTSFMIFIPRGSGMASTSASS